MNENLNTDGFVKSPLKNFYIQYMDMRLNEERFILGSISRVSTFYESINTDIKNL